MRKANNYVYVLDGKAYINLTNKCENACTFCIRNTGDGVAGTPLWLEKEPTASEVMSAFDALGKVDNEVVFCGYGEPTLALDVLKECAAELKKRGFKTRLNTNGLGNLSHGRDITPELENIDVVSVSLNSPTAEGYSEVTRSKYGLAAHPAVLAFASACKARGIKTVLTVVDVIGDKAVAECKSLCDRLGLDLRVRKYISDNYGG